MKSTARRTSQRQWVAIAFLLLLTAGAAGTTLYCAVNRLDGYNYRLSDYATIYVPQEALSIVGLQASEDAVSLRITGGLEDGELIGPDGVSIEVADDVVHIDGITTGMHTFRVSSKKRPELEREFSITSYPPATQVTSSSILMGRFDRKRLFELATQPTDYGLDAFGRAKAKLLEHSVVAGNSSMTTLRNLWSWLRPHLEHTKGAAPDPDWLRQLPAYEQYENLVTGKATGYCTHMSEAYNLFGTAAGLAMRKVDVNQRLDGISLTNHAFNEIWIPEQERWAYSDLQADVLFVRESVSGQVVNAVQICQLAQAGASGSLVATIFDPETNTIVDRPYGQTDPTCRSLLHPSATFVYHRYYPNRGSLTAWIDRYLINPELAYMMQANNSKHWIKIGAFGALILCMAAWGFVAVRVIRQRRTTD